MDIIDIIDTPITEINTIAIGVKLLTLITDDTVLLKDYEDKYTRPIMYMCQIIFNSFRYGPRDLNEYSFEPKSLDHISSENMTSMIISIHNKTNTGLQRR